VEVEMIEMDEGMLEVKEGGKARGWKEMQKRFGCTCRKRFIKGVFGRSGSAVDEAVAG
jgi:hypothetical protein